MGVAILISDKIDFKTRAIRRHPEGPFIILKGRIHQEDISIINIDVPNIGAPKYIRKILEDFKKDIDSNTLILVDLKPYYQNRIALPNKIYIQTESESLEKIYSKQMDRKKSQGNNK